MKKNDIASIILIASISVAVAYFVGDAVIGKPSNESETVRTATPITADIKQPDPKIFSEDAINPTVEVEIGGE